MALLGYIDILLALLCFLILRYWRRRLNPKEILPMSLFLGMLPELIRNVHRVHEFATDFLRTSGGTFEFKGPCFSDSNFMITSDPTNVQYIMTKNFENYPKGTEFKMMFEPFGDGIFNADSNLWKIQRKMFQSFVGQSKFEFFFEKTIWRKVVDGLIPILDQVCKSGVQVDLQEVLQRLTFDSTCIMILGFDPHYLSVDFPEATYQKAYTHIEEALLLRHILPKSWWKLQMWLQIGTEKKLSQGWKVFDEFMYKCIGSKRQELSTCTTKTKTNAKANFDMLTSYIDEEHKQGFKISDEFLRDSAFNFIIAGKDTLSACLTWFIWLVATHPNVETKILEEIKVAKKEDKKSEFFETKELNKMVYLHGALCETLRLYPPVPFNHKAPAEADILPSGHHCKKNQRILLSFYSMGRMEEIWGKDCLEFKPERWISDQGRIIHVPSFKFTAFNVGPRSCLGKKMSFVEMKIVAAAIILNYHIHVVEGHPIFPSNSILLHMKHGLNVRISKRCAS